MNAATARLARIALIFAVLIGLAVAGHFGYQEWRRQKNRDLIKPHVKLTSIYMTQMLEIELKPSNVTFGELFKKADSSVEEIDKAIVQVRSASEFPDSESTKGAVVYMETAQAVVRGISSRHRAMMLASSARDRAESETTQMRTASTSYGVRLAGDAAQRAYRDQSEQLDKALAATKDVSGRLELINRQAAWIASTFAADAAPDAKVLADATKAFAPSDAKAAAN